MKTMNEQSLLVRLDQAYQNLDRLPGDFGTEMNTLNDAELLIRRIHQCLDGNEWSADTCNAIAGMITAEGFLVGDLPTVPAGATHRDPEGNYWAIPREGDEDGTGEFWTEDGWRTSEISSAFVLFLEEL